MLVGEQGKQPRSAAKSKPRNATPKRSSLRAFSILPVALLALLFFNLARYLSKGIESYCFFLFEITKRSVGHVNKFGTFKRLYKNCLIFFEIWDHFQIPPLWPFKPNFNQPRQTEPARIFRDCQFNKAKIHLFHFILQVVLSRLWNIRAIGFGGMGFIFFGDSATRGNEN